MLNHDLRPNGKTWPEVVEVGRTPVLSAVFLAVTRWMMMALRSIRHQARLEGSYLVPVRIFIGIGWLSAFAGKAVDPGWRDGTSLSGFLGYQLQAAVGILPSYQVLMSDLFLPHAALLGWIIMLGEVLVGVAILTGSLTNAALLGGIFMNINFLLAGVPDPNVFYIVIQMVLIMAGAGSVLGVDAWLGAQKRSLFRAARAGRQLSQLPIAMACALVAIAIGTAAYAAFHITDWTAGGIHDPAATLAVLAVMTAAWIVIVAVRDEHDLSARRPLPAARSSGRDPQP